MERRLAAILATDVVGYSRLMGEDEDATLTALQAHRAELIDPKTAQYNGRTIKLMGDGALMEFPSVIEAVTFAVDIQLAMRERNADIPEDRQIVLRIGINIGDVIVEGDDIYGDGVNLAARLEGLAEPGGTGLRRAVRNQVRDKLDLDFEDLGEIEVSVHQGYRRGAGCALPARRQSLAQQRPNQGDTPGSHSIKGHVTVYGLGHNSTSKFRLECPLQSFATNIDRFCA